MNIFELEKELDFATLKVADNIEKSSFARLNGCTIPSRMGLN